MNVKIGQLMHIIVFQHKDLSILQIQNDNTINAHPGVANCNQLFDIGLYRHRFFCSWKYGHIWLYLKSIKVYYIYY